PRLQRIVAIELPACPVQLVAPRLGDDVHDRAGVASELGAVRVRLNLELLDRIGRRTHDEAGVERVVVAGAVEQEVVRLVAHAVDAEAGGDRAEAAGGRIASRAAKTGGRCDDARDEGAELREVTTVERQLDDL